MILAAIDWLTIGIRLLLLVFVLVCILMTLLILMQRPKQEGLGAAFGAGVTDQVFGARTTNVLQRGTVYLGSLFFIISLALAILIGLQNQQKSLLDGTAGTAPAAQSAAATPAVPAVEVPPPSLAEELPGEMTEPVEVPAEVPADAPAPAPEEMPIPESPPIEVPTPSEPSTEEAPAELPLPDAPPADAPPAGEANEAPPENLEEP